MSHLLLSILVTLLAAVSASVLPHPPTSSQLTHQSALFNFPSITHDSSRDHSVRSAVPIVYPTDVSANLARDADPEPAQDEDDMGSDVFDDPDYDDEDDEESDPPAEQEEQTDPEPQENSVEVNVQTGGAAKGGDDFFKDDNDPVDKPETNVDTKNETTTDNPTEDEPVQDDPAADKTDEDKPIEDDSANTETVQDDSGGPVTQTSDTSTTTDSDQTVDTRDDNVPKEDADPPLAPAPDSPEGVPGNETAFSAFSLAIMGENESDELQAVPVFENSDFVGMLQGCPKTSEIEDEITSACHIDQPYVDRLSFKFTYKPEITGYDIAEPIVTTSTTSNIKPEILEYGISPESGTGSFTVVYHCVPGSQVNSTSAVGFHFQITPDQAIDTTWAKECGHGRNQLIDFGFMSYNNEFVSFNEDGTYGNEDKGPLEVGPLDLSTILVMRLKTPALTQDYVDPVVTSSSPDVGVSLRQTVFSGTVVSDVDTKYAIMYDCQTSAMSDISFTVAIPPWDNVTALWRKDCGGDHAGALLIGLSGDESVEVMQDKELDPKFNATELTTIDEAYRKNLYQVDGNQDKIVFHLTNSDDTSDIHIQAISTTMSTPDVVHATVKVPRVSLTSAYIPPLGATLKRGKSMRLMIHFTCMKAGVVVVLVTLPALRYKNVEFGFIKECHAPVALHRSGFLQTANSLLGAIFFILVGGIIGSIVYIRKRRSSVKYAPVSLGGSQM